MKRSGFTILEAFVLLAVLLILAAILFPVFVRSRDGHGHRNPCQSNLRQIAFGFKQYIQDYDEKYPIAKNSNSGLRKIDNWAGQLEPYIKTSYVFQCPSDDAATDNKKTSYGYNARLSKIEDKKLYNSALVVLNFEVVADAGNFTQTGTGPEAVTASTRHIEGSNFSFVDGHVKWFKPGKVGALPPSKGQPTFVPG
jgi:prepilin-type processing-associated H-X9-DG protein